MTASPRDRDEHPQPVYPYVECPRCWRLELPEEMTDDGCRVCREQAAAAAGDDAQRARAKAIADHVAWAAGREVAR